MADLWWTKSARRALETQMKTAAAAATPAVDLAYPALGLPDLSGTIHRFIRPTFHPAPVRVMEMGPNGRKEGRGFFKLGIFTRPVDGQDANDNLAGIAALAFPYNLNLVRQQIRVIIGTVDHGQAVPTPTGWLYSAVDVNWIVERTT